MIKKVLIVTNPIKDTGFEVTELVREKLNELDIESAIYENQPRAEVEENVDSFVKQCDLILVIGGDGSIIDSSHLAIDNNIPILGINLGRVGYLAELDRSDIDMLKLLKSGTYTVNERMLLNVGFESDNRNNNLHRYAVNDVVVSCQSRPAISCIRVEDSLGNSIKFRADGIILSTPQGSTAYSLSSGGPILAHDVEGIVTTPVSPHSFFNRSVIFNASETIYLTNMGDLPLGISIDGRLCDTLDSGRKCIVRKAPKSVKMLTFSKNSMFTNLFNKIRIMEGIE